MASARFNRRTMVSVTGAGLLMPAIAKEGWPEAAPDLQPTEALRTDVAEVPQQIQYLAGAPDGQSILRTLDRQENLRDLDDPIAATGNLQFLSDLPNAGAISLRDKLRQNRDVRDVGIIADSTDGSDGTAQTQPLAELLTAMETAGIRGPLRVPYGCKFDLLEAFSTAPIGSYLEGDFSVNVSEPPGYRTKLMGVLSRDAINDDMQFVVGSSYHPAITLMNTGEEAGPAGDGYFGTILHSIGRDYLGNVRPGPAATFMKSPEGDSWALSLRCFTPYATAAANPQLWRPRTAYAAGAFCISDGTTVYRTRTGGTSGGRPPSGRGTSISDGGVSWDFVSIEENIDHTAFRLDLETGHLGQFGRPNIGPVRLQQQVVGVGSHSIEMEIDGDVVWRHEVLGLEVLRASTTEGLRFGIAPGANWLLVSGANPSAPVTGFGKLENSATTMVASIAVPPGRRRMRIGLRADNGNTTLEHNPSASGGMELPGARSLPLPTGEVVWLRLDTDITGAWQFDGASFDAFSLIGSKSHEFGSLADGATQITTVAVPGARLGDFAQASIDLDLQGMSMTAWVSSPETVSIRLRNETGTVLDMPPATLRALVRKAL